MNQQTIDHIFACLAALDPAPRTELIYTNPYTLLVAVVLSAQSTDKGVNKATASLFQHVDNPDAMVELGETRLLQAIRTIGLAPTKAKNIIALSKRLIEHYHSQVPAVFEELITLPGVGRKTAKVILNCAFGQPTIAVDTHVFRVSNRLGIVQTTSVEKTEAQLEQVIPDQWKTHAHHWLILLGRYICKARAPLCATCPVARWCEYPYKTV